MNHYPGDAGDGSKSACRRGLRPDDQAVELIAPLEHAVNLHEAVARRLDLQPGKLPLLGCPIEADGSVGVHRATLRPPRCVDEGPPPD